MEPPKASLLRVILYMGTGKRAGVYFDGFNIYHAICELRKPHLKWTCYYSLASLIARNSGDTLMTAKLFTAYAEWKPDSAKRHKAAVAAWDARGVQVILGRFKHNDVECEKCLYEWQKPEEKESDVNFAAHLVRDCLSGTIDVAYIVTGDTDMVGALRLLRHACPGIEIVIVSVLNRRTSFELQDVAHRKATLSQRMLYSCRLPETIEVEGTLVASCPRPYRLPKK